MSYLQLVELNKKLKFQMEETLRLLAFRRESIERAIFVQDVIESKVRDEMVIRSHFVKHRDTRVCHQKLIANIGMNLIVFNSIVFIWYAHAKTVIMILLSMLFGGASIMLIYAEFAFFVGFDDQLISDLVNLPIYEMDAFCYFKSFVSLKIGVINLEWIDLLFTPTFIHRGRNQLWTLQHEGKCYICTSW